MYEPEKLIRESLGEIADYVSDDTRYNVNELLSAGEPGIALEVLCSQLIEYDVRIPLYTKEKLVIGAKIMGMRNDDIDRLKVLK